METKIQSIPEAKLLLSSLRSVGYNEETAIADIVDKYLPELYYNGTLAEIAKEYLGTDSGVTSMAENGMFEEATLEEYQAAHE